MDADNLALKNYTEASKNIHFVANTSNIAATTIHIAKLESEKKSAKYEKELLKVLLNERAQILKQLKLSEKDLVPEYFCKKCSDTGIADGEYCLCYKNLLNEQLSKLNGGNLDKTHIFKAANLKLLKKDSDMQKAYLSMQKFCELYPNSKRKIISLVGEVGVGKSYLTECVCNALIAKGALVQFLTSFNFNNTMLKYHTEFNQDKMTYLDSVLEPDVLVIDDLGTEPMLQNVTKEYLFLVLNERLNSNKFTFITTNLNLNELMNRYGERIYSRLTHKQNALPLNITGNDLRRQ
jgi:DNA replication protein DnaC